FYSSPNKFISSRCLISSGVVGILGESISRRSVIGTNLCFPVFRLQQEKDDIIIGIFWDKNKHQSYKGLKNDGSFPISNRCNNRGKGRNNMYWFDYSNRMLWTLKQSFW